MDVRSRLRRDRRRCLGLLAWLALAAGAASCGGDETVPDDAVTAPSVMSVTSTAFRDGEPLPTRFTCDGDGRPPPLAWSGVPRGTGALALVVDDPDAPRGTFVHWVVLDMAPDTSGLPAGEVPSGAVQARSSAGEASYYPPCPPSGTHHYRFTVYALSGPTGLTDGADLSQALRAVESRATGQGRLVGTYHRRG